MAERIVNEKVPCVLRKYRQARLTAESQGRCRCFHVFSDFFAKLNKNFHFFTFLGIFSINIFLPKDALLIKGQNAYTDGRDDRRRTVENGKRINNQS